ncbi:NAD(P)/FAD-dependent oxidoreductase [soil metagenome]
MTYDAIIIGAGPGGSTAATVLSQAGKKVLILEREKFPRFHVGESLIPYVNDELRSIGVWEKIEREGFMPKLGAEFVLGNSAAQTQVLFGRHLSCEYAQTFQVERSRFDQVLLDHALEMGAECWQETLVDAVAMNDGGATVTCRKGGEMHELKARWLLDASGRDALLGRQLGLPKTDLGMPKKFATFAHFHGVKRNPPPTDGNITVVRLKHGWCWIIPLDAEKTSVGLVQELGYFKSTGLTPEESFTQTVATTPELTERLGRAERVSEFYHAGDYTYRYLKNAGARWMLIGDAAGFIDPIFSSGVMLAVKSGYRSAGEIVAADKAGTALSTVAQARYTKEVGKMCKVFLNMIRMFYNNDSFAVFMTPPPARMEAALNNLVAGNTDLGWQLRFRVWLFYGVCSLQKYFNIVPRLELDGEPAMKAS